MRCILLVALALCLGACQAPAPAPLPAPLPADLPADFPMARYAGLPAGSLFQPAPGSRVDVLVRRGGAMAALGHNHVLTGQAIRGRVHWDGSRGFADLVLPVADLAVDGAAARARHGEDFAGVPPDDAIAGTRANLLGPQVLDGAMHPWLRARITDLRAGEGALTGHLHLQVREHSHRRPLRLPGAAEATRPLRVALRLSHADLGLEPFSVLGGALRVADGIEVHCELHLEPVESPPP